MDAGFRADCSPRLLPDVYIITDVNRYPIKREKLVVVIQALLGRDRQNDKLSALEEKAKEQFWSTEVNLL